MFLPPKPSSGPFIWLLSLFLSDPELCPCWSHLSPLVLSWSSPALCPVPLSPELIPQPARWFALHLLNSALRALWCFSISVIQVRILCACLLLLWWVCSVCRLSLPGVQIPEPCPPGFPIPWGRRQCGQGPCSCSIQPHPVPLPALSKYKGCLLWLFLWQPSGWTCVGKGAGAGWRAPCGVINRM